MNEFDIHVGRINEEYRSAWNNINPLTQPQDGPNMRSILIKATQAVSQIRNLFETLDDFVQKHPEIKYVPGSGRPIHVDNNVHWPVDTWLLSYDRFEYEGNVYQRFSDIVLTPHDEHFGTFFALKWRNVDIMQGDTFLSYQQQQGNWNNKASFVQFLRKIVIKHSDVLVPSKFDRLVEEYSNLNQAEQGAVETLAGLKAIEIKLPKVPTRRNADNKTVLSQKETVWFFEYLREVGVILKDTSYLKQNNLHKAIQVLTGYSDVNMRKSEVLASLSKTELENLRKVLNRLTYLINMNLASKKGHKK